MTSKYLKQILTGDVLRDSVMKDMFKALDLPAGSRGLDVGCGPGLQCIPMAQSTGPDGHVTGLDVEREFLEYGRNKVDAAGVAETVSFVKGSVRSIPASDDAFDWVWSSDCVGYAPWDPVPLLEELIRVTRPGGRLFIAAWSSENLLPGYPLLEAKLKATKAGRAPFSGEMHPSRHFMKFTGFLRKTGLVDTGVSTFAGTVRAPLSPRMYEALESLFEMMWDGAEGELSEKDAAEFRRILSPQSPGFILKDPDYYAFFTYSVFSGTVPDASISDQILSRN